MLKTIDAKLQNDQILLMEKIPYDRYEVKNVKVIFELIPIKHQPSNSLSKIKGLLKGVDLAENEYYEHLEKKYL